MLRFAYLGQYNTYTESLIQCTAPLPAMRPFALSTQAFPSAPSLVAISFTRSIRAFELWLAKPGSMVRPTMPKFLVLGSLSISFSTS